MGTSERSQPTLFDLGESERDTTAWPTPRSGGTARETKIAPSYEDSSHGWSITAAVHDSMSDNPNRNWTSSPAATPASRSHTPGSDWARRMTAISGRRCAGSLTSPGPVSSWLRTLLGTSRWASTLFWLSWKRTATPAGRSLYRLVPSTPSTGATASGSWPTPLAGNQGNEGGNYGGMPLRNSVEAWPTPRHEGFDAGGHRGTTDSLHSAVKAQPWGTPTSRDWKDGSSVENVPENGLLGRQAVNRSGQAGMKLHGRWTLALMAFPPDWCDDLPPDPLEGK